MAERDQLLQIIVGALDRHAAHRNVLAAMLAALRQHDAERARGDDGILEKQFVEIAHAVEQQAIRIGRLDLDILRDHRRRRVAFVVAGDGPGGVGGLVHGRHASNLHGVSPLCSVDTSRSGRAYLNDEIPRQRMERINGQNAAASRSEDKSNIMTRMRADLILLLVAFIWGTSFIAQKHANETMGPISFVGVRFLLSWIGVAPLARAV